MKKRAVKKSVASMHVIYHKHGTVWVKGQMRVGVACGHWEWFRSNGTKDALGLLRGGEQAGE